MAEAQADLGIAPAAFSREATGCAREMRRLAERTIAARAMAITARRLDMSQSSPSNRSNFDETGARRRTEAVHLIDYERIFGRN